MHKSHRIGTLLLCGALTVMVCDLAHCAPNPIRKLKDVVIYEDPKFYCAFPSIVRRADGELLVAFRRAPERR
ncbi:MAG TPA: exo-alpha-sialidase, partial [Verrucomicrobiae bacterium]